MPLVNVLKKLLAYKDILTHLYDDYPAAIQRIGLCEPLQGEP